MREEPLRPPLGGDVPTGGIAPDDPEALGDLADRASKKRGASRLDLLIRVLRAIAEGEGPPFPPRGVVAVVAVLIYFLVPMDLVPDVVPGAGILDDVAFAMVVTEALRRPLDVFRRWEERRRR